MAEHVVAGVAVENAVYHFDKLFDYLIPEHLRDKVKEGCRVMIPFGNGGKKRQGIVLTLSGKSEYSGLKAIVAVLDRAPLLSREMLEMIPWIKERYFCTYFEAAKLLLPAGINYKIKENYSLEKPLSELEEDAYSIIEWQILQYLDSRGKAVTRESLEKLFGFTPENQTLERLYQRGTLKKSSEALRNIGDATLKMVRLEMEEDQLPKLTPKQKEVVKVLLDVGTASLKELCYFTGVSQAVVSTLVAKGIASYYEEEVYRNPYAEVRTPEDPEEITLSQAQEEAYCALLEKYRSGIGGVSLLYGITGSGKTLVFTRLIDDVLADGKNVIVMVPEISLTPQTIALFHQRYGKKVAVFHSGLSLAQRMDEWKRVQNGDAVLAVGTRSAVFAPFDHIGLIIMDEEQEYTYKSESAPRYHARDVAKFRCAYHKALLLLSSATPSIESYYFAEKGRYSLHCLPERYGPAQLPEVTVVDMNLELEKGNASILSSPLLQAIHDNLEQKRQSIILLNRRGYHTFVSCKACGHVVTCPHCSISMTYHAANQRLMCHYCGYSIPFTKECPECHEMSVHYSGSGTQKAEEQLQECFPEARILRMDTDSTMTRVSYEKKLHEFAQGGYDMIVGTQMVAKGLNFENVTLVGVLSADQALYSDDFRSSERAFDLLTQVVGRSGRGDLAGEAMIQTYTPENPVIRLAAMQDYLSFYRGEIQFRKAMLYPPFADIVVVGFVGTEETKTREASFAFLRILGETAAKEYPDLPMRVLSPSPAAVAKVSNKYRYKMIIKCRNEKRFRKMLSGLLITYEKMREYSTVTAFIDCNPDIIM